MADNQPQHAEYVSPILAVPQPVRRKKRVSKTVYWEECPKCGNKLGHDSKGQLVSTSWFQDTRLDPPERTYLPCYCTVRAGEQIDGRDDAWVEQFKADRAAFKPGPTDAHTDGSQEAK